jgi:polyisoprenyl-teichoic acid--peptidoglycan teichoic acid transferase
LKIKKWSKKKKILLLTVTGLIASTSGVAGYMYHQLHHVKIDKSDEALGIQRPPVSTQWASSEREDFKDKRFIDSETNFDNQIINIALFGVDRRKPTDRGRADAIMILTVDFKDKKLKLSSLMRDMYVDIENHGKTKLNHAYAYGGAPLAIKTINQTFGTDIRDYVTVDFFTLEKIIDAIGGVEIDVKENEYPLINQYMNEVARIEHEKPVYLKKAGLQTLNGKQAVAYARIRHVGNGDFERTERQRKVLYQMIEKLQNMDKVELTKLAMKVLPYVETSLSFNTIMDMGMQYLKSGITTIEQERFPKDGYWRPYMKNGVWYMKFDEEQTKLQLQEFIYEKNLEPSPFDSVENSTESKETTEFSSNNSSSMITKDNNNSSMTPSSQSNEHNF